MIKKSNVQIIEKAAGSQIDFIGRIMIQHILSIPIEKINGKEGAKYRAVTEDEIKKRAITTLYGDIFKILTNSVLDDTEKIKHIKALFSDNW